MSTTAAIDTRVELYDTTLRDGTQQEGISLSVADKLKVARTIDSLGLPYIEGGWPGANPKDTEFFKRCAEGELDLDHAQLVAFGMTRKPGREAAGDENLAALLEARTPIVTLVGKSDIRHVTEAINTTGEENLAMLRSSFELIRSEGRRAFYDAEHFFDGYRRDRTYALEALQAAVAGGAECVVLCDTNGGMLPDEVRQVVTDVVATVGPHVQVGIHVHNDTDCAVANSLVAMECGVTHVQGTINGLGERAGNANLSSIIPNLTLKMGMEGLVADGAVARMNHVAHRVAEIMNVAVPPSAPYVGHAAFAHKAGLHASALAKNTDLYQHIEPARVGNELRMLVSELAGRATVVMKGADLGLDLDGDVANRVLQQVKDLEHLGYSFEAADASFELLVRRESGDITERFRLESFRTIVERREDGTAIAEATVKVWVGEERLIGTGEGNGPVDALDHAFRAAVEGRLPLDALHLADYKVRILDAGAGTGATTRVLITSSDADNEYVTVGVDSNIIEASWKAMQDAYDASLQATAGH
ncbi:citramalate synthase [Euzebya tangerina]|uniref:citramalate synthase n=1 Tax=Euzebya tangerina TaxID=591198 RepID=UPI000E321E8B|nr:citramalate synthase [Euzebya tangerina]